MNNKPKAYQQGFVEFYKLRFKVTEDTLIPRPETELLVDEVLKFLQKNPAKNIVLDLGTGTGVIAISIAKNLESHPGGVKLIATDISEKALEVAKQNAKLYGVENIIEFVLSDLLDNVTLNKVKCINSKLYSLPKGSPPLGSQDDNLIIVTNLPYIPTERINYLDSSVKDYEPHIALDGGADGFELYRKLFHQILEKSINFDLLIGEIDYTHGETALSKAQRYFPDYNVEVKLDLYHKQRVLIIAKPKD